MQQQNVFQPLRLLPQSLNRILILLQLLPSSCSLVIWDQGFVHGVGRGSSLGFAADCYSYLPTALSVFILGCSLFLQKVSLGTHNESVFDPRREEVIDSLLPVWEAGRGGPQRQGPRPSALCHPSHIIIPTSAWKPFSPPPPLQTCSYKFDLAARPDPIPGKENKYCYNGNNIYSEQRRQTGGAFEGDPSVLPDSYLILIHEGRGYSY